MRCLILSKRGCDFRISRAVQTRLEGLVQVGVKSFALVRVHYTFREMLRTVNGALAAPQFEAHRQLFSRRPHRVELITFYHRLLPFPASLAIELHCARLLPQLWLSRISFTIII